MNVATRMVDVSNSVQTTLDPSCVVAQVAINPMASCVPVSDD